jgi:hypothetical protein
MGHFVVDSLKETMPKKVLKEKNWTNRMVSDMCTVPHTFQMSSGFCQTMFMSSGQWGGWEVSIALRNAFQHLPYW